MMTVASNLWLDLSTGPLCIASSHDWILETGEQGIGLKDLLSYTQKNPQDKQAQAVLYSSILQSHEGTEQ